MRFDGAVYHPTATTGGESPCDQRNRRIVLGRLPSADMRQPPTTREIIAWSLVLILLAETDVLGYLLWQERKRVPAMAEGKPIQPGEANGDFSELNQDPPDLRTSDLSQRTIAWI